MARQRFGERGNRQRFVDLWGENVFVISLRFSFLFIAAHNFQKKNMLAADSGWRKLSFMLECDLCYKLNGDDDDESNHVAHKKSSRIHGVGVNETS